jgi:hypothetical protein
VGSDVLLEEVSYLTDQHRKFLAGVEAETARLRKEVATGLRECGRLAEEEDRSCEEAATSLMRAVHTEVAWRVKSVSAGRARTEEQVVEALQRVVASCLRD